MKRVLLFGLSAIVLATSAGNSYAQPQLGQVSAYYLRPSLVVSAPASVAGRKDYTNTYEATAPWGGNPDTATIVNIPLKKATDSLACTSGSGNYLAGNYAFIFRGTCEFGAKALEAQQRGARGVIIVNNQAGLLAMGAGAVGGGVTIPVFMITREDGLAINSQLNAGQTVTISYFKRWGRGLQNDLAIAPGSMPLPHAQVIPFSQMSAGNGAPTAYLNYAGAYVANIGTATQNNVKLRAVTTWYPSAGASAVIRRDSITTTSFLAIDSIRDDQYLMPVNFQLTPTSTGKFSTRYEVSATATDQSLFDNIDSVTLNVSDSIFSKGGYDLAAGTVNRASGIRAGTATPPANFTWGPLFYVARSRYRAAKAQFSVYGSAADLGGTADVVVYLYRWRDGSKGAPQDSLIEGAELSLVGIANKQFVAGDASGGVFTADFTDPVDDTKPAVMRDSGWYWVGVQIDNTAHFVGVDNRSNFYARAHAAQNNGSSRTREFWAPQVFGAALSLDTTTTGTTDTLRMIPFFDRAATDIDQIAYTYSADADMAPSTETYTPAVALHISRNPVPTTSIKSVGQSAFNSLEIFPNPALTSVNLKYDLASEAARMTIHIVNSVGQSVRSQTLENAKNGTASISTAGLASGQYYLVVSANGKATARPFAIQGK